MQKMNDVKPKRSVQMLGVIVEWLAWKNNTDISLRYLRESLYRYAMLVSVVAAP